MDVDRTDGPVERKSSTAPKDVHDIRALTATGSIPLPFPREPKRQRDAPTSKRGR